MNKKVFEEIFPLTSEHPDAQVLSDYVAGNLKAENARQVEVHTAACSLCNDALDGLLQMKDPSTFSENVKSVTDKTIELAKPSTDSPRSSFGWIWYVAAGIILLVSALWLFNPGPSEPGSIAQELYPEVIGLSEITAGDNTNESLIKQAEEALRSGRYPLVMELTAKIGGKDEFYQYGRLMRAQAFLRKSEPDTEMAFVILQSIISNGENDYIDEADWLLGQVYLQNGNLNAAEGHFLRIAESDSPYKENAERAMKLLKP